MKEKHYERDNKLNTLFLSPYSFMLNLFGQSQKDTYKSTLNWVEVIKFVLFQGKI